MSVISPGPGKTATEIPANADRQQREVAMVIGCLAFLILVLLFLSIED